MTSIARCLATSALLTASAESNAALMSVDGGLMVDDTALGVTWANNVGANLTWNPNAGPGAIEAWRKNPNADSHGGHYDWQLGTGAGSSNSPSAIQLSYLFYDELGSQSQNRIVLSSAGSAFERRLPEHGGVSLQAATDTGYGKISVSPFPGVPRCSAWVVRLSNDIGGLQATVSFAMAVRVGESPVPLPSAGSRVPRGLGAAGMGGEHSGAQPERSK